MFTVVVFTVFYTERAAVKNAGWSFEQHGVGKEVSPPER